MDQFCASYIIGRKDKIEHQTEFYYFMLFVQLRQDLQHHTEWVVATSLHSGVSRSVDMKQQKAYSFVVHFRLWHIAVLFYTYRDRWSSTVCVKGVSLVSSSVVYLGQAIVCVRVSLGRFQQGVRKQLHTNLQLPGFQFVLPHIDIVVI